MKNLLNKIQDEQDYPVRITFEVICDSDTSMQEGESIKERILDYIDQCTDTMDESMRHWGDHDNDIEPVKVELYDEDENLIDVTDDILEEINPDALPILINDNLKQLKKYIIEFNKQDQPLMDKPDDLRSFSVLTTLGKNLHTEEPEHDDPEYWIYPDGVEEKIEDDTTYKVWYYSRDAADPADFTSWNYVKYICKIQKDKKDLLEEINNIHEIFLYNKKK